MTRQRDAGVEVDQRGSRVALMAQREAKFLPGIIINDKTSVQRVTPGSFVDGFDIKMEFLKRLRSRLVIRKRPTKVRGQAGLAQSAGLTACECNLVLLEGSGRRYAGFDDMLLTDSFK